MNILTERILDVLSPQDPCLGAFFSTFTFDPVFFENNVLRAVLHLSSDPIEQSDRYHYECRHALQRVPVAVVVDAGERQGGRRLPYDLLEVSSVVFHPKTVLLLFRDHARLVVGSGNLTSHGYGGNSELFFHTDLHYDKPADAGALATFRAHLSHISALIRTRGSQLALFEEELRCGVGDQTNANVPGTFRLLDSTAASVLQQVLDLMPPGAKLHSIGLAAPFYEKDDVGDLDESSVFGALLERAVSKVDIDVAVGWDNVSVHATEPIQIDKGFGRLWTWEYEEKGKHKQVHVVPTSLGSSQIRYRNKQGHEERRSANDARQALANRKLWIQPDPEVFVPGHLLKEVGGVARELRLWLHPSTRLVEGRPQYRPLHAKLLLLGYESNGEAYTLVVMGSPNMSRRALLLAVRDGGNVEVAVAMRLRGSLTLLDLMPDIVRTPEKALSIREREFPARAVNHALAVESAVHDAQAGTLTVHWSENAAALQGWRLLYQSRELAAALHQPTEKVLHVRPFALQPASAELSLQVGEQVFSIPILVSDLVYLPADTSTPALNLHELLMLAARRIGRERAIQIASARAQRTPPNRAGDDLVAFYSERFSPTDVFRAWWCGAEDLSNPALSVTGFRFALEGATGTGAIWAAILSTARKGHMPSEEAWFYGAELLKTLHEMSLSDRDEKQTHAKRKLLSAFRERVKGDLRELLTDQTDIEVVRRVKAFYSEASAAKGAS